MSSAIHLAPPASRTTLRTRLNDALTLWHLLSLDAPTVAALWTWFIARATKTPVPATGIAAMFLAVWILYAADRLLDSRFPDTRFLEARHLFHHRHRRAFRWGIVLASLALAPLLLSIPAPALRLYLIAGALLVAYFLLIHAAPAASPHRLPKELAVGAFFAAATFIPTVARSPSLRPQLLLPALLFAILCSLNCLFIYRWEHPAPTQDTCHPTTRLALRRLTVITVTLIAASLVIHTPITIAITIAASLLLLLHRNQTLARTTLRAAADVTLLTPLLILPFLR